MEIPHVLMLPALRISCIICVMLCCVQPARADHISGGEISYVFAGESNGQYRYSVTLKLMMLCSSTRDFNNPTIISFFNRSTNARVRDVTVNLSRTEMISYAPGGDCITNPPVICYMVGYYNVDVLLPVSQFGYTIAAQVIYRVDGMKNMVPGYDQVGATYTAEIPGNVASDCGPENNSAKFSGNDLVVICADNALSYSFAATDADGDRLRYDLCGAYRESTISFGQDIVPPGPPPYNSVPYGQGYSGEQPLGPNVRIDPVTGELSGIAPAEGTYVISVCVSEIRDNTVIAIQRKDIQVTITNCSIAAATLLPDYKLCGDTKTLTIANNSSSPLINNYYWQFETEDGATIFTSDQEVPTYTFADTGLYTVRLVINPAEACSDSAVTTVRVYPGLVPGFRFDGTCINNAIQFTDTTTSVYGTVNAWQWDFDDNTANDISALQDPAYLFASAGNKNVRLIVGDSKGCMDTVITPISIIDEPPLSLAFSDTLICVTDSVQLQATGTGTFSWSPVLYMAGENSPSPTVAPTATTTYLVALDLDGCVNTDSVIVHVTDRVSLQVMPDTTICSGDTIRLNLVSDGLRYTWSPAAQVIDATIQTPLAVTPATTTYQVLAEIGSCSATGAVTVTTVPYPVAYAGSDTTICFQSQVQLNAGTDGSSFTWSPQSTLFNTTSLNPLAFPATTTTYILTAYDTKGCPKPGTDAVTVTVLPDIKANAGNDTAVVTGQPVQLNATGGVRYQWSPSTGLSSATSASPVALFTSPSAGIRYKVQVFNEAGCADSAFVTVKVYNTKPSVFVPTAFTPNGDGLNDLLRPVAAGMQRIEYFRVFNRWGQLVFNTSATGAGWNGFHNGQQQATGVYVWMIRAVDYTGAPFEQRGTVTLIR